MGGEVGEGLGWGGVPSRPSSLGEGLYLVVGQHVESLPVSFDLGGEVFVLQNRALSSALAPFCQKKTRATPLKTVILTIDKPGGMTEKLSFYHRFWSTGKVL